MAWHRNQSRIPMPFVRAFGLAVPLDNTLGTASALRTTLYDAFACAKSEPEDDVSAGKIDPTFVEHGVSRFLFITFLFAKKNR
jgi:hypothetical protein